MADEAPISFNEQLRRLRKGKSVSVTERLALDAIPEEGVNGVLARLRRTINAQVSKLRDRESGSDFRVESAATLNNDNDAMLVVVAVTRL